MKPSQFVSSGDISKDTDKIIEMMQRDPKEPKWVEMLCCRSSSTGAQQRVAYWLSHACTRIPLVVETLVGMLYIPHGPDDTVSDLAAKSLCSFGEHAKSGRDGVMAFLLAAGMTPEPEHDQLGLDGRLNGLAEHEMAFLCLITMGESEAVSEIFSTLLSSKSKYAQQQATDAIQWFAESAKDPVLGSDGPSLQVHERMLDLIEPFTTGRSVTNIHKAQSIFTENRPLRDAPESD